MGRPEAHYRLTVITNAGPDSELAISQTQAPRSRALDSAPLSISWPSQVYSLAHVAIPFPPDDPVYDEKMKPHAKYRGLPSAGCSLAGKPDS